MKKRCILKQIREAGLSQVGLQISLKWAKCSRMDCDNFEQFWLEILKKNVVFKANTHIAHLIRKCFLDKICIVVRGDLGPKSGAQKYPKYEQKLWFLY